MSVVRLAGNRQHTMVRIPMDAGKEWRKVLRWAEERCGAGMAVLVGLSRTGADGGGLSRAPVLSSR